MVRRTWLTGTWSSRIAFLIAAGPACHGAYLLGVALGPAKSPAHPNTPTKHETFLPNGLEADRADLNCGEVWEDPDYVRPVKVTNRSDREVRVTNMTGGCECTAVEPKAFTLAPGQSIQLR